MKTLWRREARYTDGTIVMEGDPIRSIQAGGGLMHPAGWKEGVAKKIIGGYGDPDELYLFTGGRYYHIYSHVTERNG